MELWWVLVMERLQGLTQIFIGTKDYIHIYWLKKKKKCFTPAKRRRNTNTILNLITQIFIENNIFIGYRKKKAGRKNKEKKEKEKRAKNNLKSQKIFIENKDCIHIYEESS